MNELMIHQTESLFQIEKQLAGLVASREECETEEDRKAVDEAIALYVKKEIRKVDSIRGYLRHCDMMAEAAAEEVKRLSALGHTWKSRRERLLDLCRELMLEFGEKRLDGLHGSIVLKGNGGLQALEMGNPGLIPEEMCDYRGFITSKCWTAILEACNRVGVSPAEWEGVQLERVPRQAMVREALKQGSVVGARLQDRGVHVEVR